MKYKTELDIDLPRDEVVRLVEDPDNIRYWQEGFISMEHLEGEPGKKGAKSRLRYKMGRREIEMVETIVENDLPNALKATYEAKGVFNVIENRFIAESPSRTRWEAENEFRFTGFMSLVGRLMPGAFRKQSQKYLDDFKRFAERRKDAPHGP